MATRRVLPAASARTPAVVPDEPRFEAFVRAHQNTVYATAVRLLGRPADAEDIAQDVFLKAYEHFDTIGDSPTAAGWLRTVARNACLNHLTRHRSRWRLFSEMFAGEADVEAVSTLNAQTRVSDAGRAEEDQTRLEAALRSLPDAQRVPLVLFHFEGASYLEIAELLGVSLGKVKTDIHRGRDALKAILTRDGTR